MDFSIFSTKVCENVLSKGENVRHSHVIKTLKKDIL